MKPLTHYWQSFNFVSLALAPLSFIFCLLVSLRRLFYRIGWLKSSSSKLPVIIVGNIYIGGNGKTPFVIWLAEQLKSAGYHPGIVSRGYGASSDTSLEKSSLGNSSLQKEAPWPRVVNLEHDIQLFGDEPVLIHQATHCPVVIDPVRSHAVEKIQNETSCDVIISDDGLQHYAMSRWIEINITDARRLYGNGLCLPAGPLREGQGRLKSVDYIVYNTSQGNPSDIMTEASSREFTMDYEVSHLQPVSSSVLTNSMLTKKEQPMTLDDFKGKIVHAVAGIGEPDNFFRLLKNYGIMVIEHSFADHYQYRQEDLHFAPEYPVIMTEKDAVKCRHLSLPQYWYLPIKAKVDNQLADSILARLKLFKKDLNQEI